MLFDGPFKQQQNVLCDFSIKMQYTPHLPTSLVSLSHSVLQTHSHLPATKNGVFHTIHCDTTKVGIIQLYSTRLAIVSHIELS